MSVFTEEQRLIIEQTKTYICALPNGSNLTLAQAIKAACPGKIEELNPLDFRMIMAIQDELNKTKTVIDLSDHDDKVEGLPFNLDFYVWQKRLQKVQIISNLLKYGPRPLEEDPVEQRLTISFNGGIWFTEYAFGSGEYGSKYPIKRKMQFSIGKERSARILSVLADYLDSEEEAPFATDIGQWDIISTYPDGSRKGKSGSMFGKVIIDDVNIAELIQSYVSIDEMALFGD